MCGEACRVTGSEVIFPEVAFGGEDDGVFKDGRAAVVAFLLGGGCGAGQQEGCGQKA